MATSSTVELSLHGAALRGDLVVPTGASGIVLFAHGSGSSRMSPRNRRVAVSLNDAGFATLLLDLLTAREESADDRTRVLRFDIGLLGDRLTAAVDWLATDARTAAMSIGAFGASTGAAAALVAAASRPDRVSAVVSRGGRPDLAGDQLSAVRAPTLLVVGGADSHVLRLNEQASRMLSQCELVVVPGATHLFEEPGALERVTELAIMWFRRHLADSG
ncbi:MAG TPA: dienelactone hydrolase family protein [Actinomycetes bacterium]|nr:dienelactone hydrolase family protein [Actinomycetes bacterium]